MTLQEKHKALQDYISSLGSVAVAFSGGVDSTLLLRVAHDVLGDSAIAVTASSSLYPHRETHEAEDFCRENGITQIVIPIDELEIDGFRHNPKNRCYLCKRAIFTKIITLAHERSISYVAEGSNTDDLGDYRPGMQAVDELGVKSPLRVSGMSKADVRGLSFSLGLKTWDKPSFACLASRFVYGEEITREKLRMVDDAEELLLSLGFRQMRVRVHSDMARIEILPEDFTRIIQDDTRTKIYDAFKAMGFSYVTLDMKGYRTGSMNETISRETATTH